MHHDYCQVRHQLHEVIPVGDCVHAVHRDPGKPEQSGLIFPVNIERGAGKSTRSDRRSFEYPLPAVIKPAYVSFAHHGISHQMLSE